MAIPAPVVAGRAALALGQIEGGVAADRVAGTPPRPRLLPPRPRSLGTAGPAGLVVGPLAREAHGAGVLVAVGGEGRGGGRVPAPGVGRAGGSRPLGGGPGRGGADVGRGRGAAVVPGGEAANLEALCGLDEALELGLGHGGLALVHEVDDALDLPAEDVVEHDDGVLAGVVLEDLAEVGAEGKGNEVNFSDTLSFC